MKRGHGADLEARRIRDEVVWWLARVSGTSRADLATLLGVSHETSITKMANRGRPSSQTRPWTDDDVMQIGLAMENADRERSD